MAICHVYNYVLVFYLRYLTCLLLLFSYILYLVGIAPLHHHHGGDSNSHSFQCRHGYGPQALPQTQCTASHPGELDQYLGQSRHWSKPQHLE